MRDVSGQGVRGQLGQVVKFHGPQLHAAAVVKEMQQVPLELQAWKEALASGLPVVFGCLLFESFDDCNRNGGVVPMPDPSEMARESHGGHAMCAVGYSDREKVFLVRNSWGDPWGDAGGVRPVGGANVLDPAVVVF